MSVLFNHAIRHEFVPQNSNPIAMVRQSAKRKSIPDILDVAELVALFEELSHREHVMVLLDALTGLRCGELMAPKWAGRQLLGIGTFGDAVDLPAGGGTVQNRSLDAAGSSRLLNRRGVVDVEADFSLQPARWPKRNTFLPGAPARPRLEQKCFPTTPRKNENSWRRRQSWNAAASAVLSPSLHSTERKGSLPASKRPYNWSPNSRIHNAYHYAVLFFCLPRDGMRG